MSLSTHVLDTEAGRPATDVPVQLEHLRDGSWGIIGSGVTDQDGRCRDLAAGPLDVGVHRLVFDTTAYYAASGRPGFYPFVPVVFQVTAADRHHHVPLMLSRFGYSTYLGS